MTIIFYDISSTIPGKAWNPTTSKTRYVSLLLTRPRHKAHDTHLHIRFVLNYKGISYKTEWVEYPDIAEHSKKLGLKPTGKNPWDGTDYYTLPAIYDPSTGKYINDTWEIAVYLEKQYPDTPSLFYNNTHALQAAFLDAYNDSLASLWPFIVPPLRSIFIPRTEEYFVKTREMAFGVTFDELLPKGDRAVAEWAKLKADLGKVDTWFGKTDPEEPFMLGNKISYVDLVVVGYIRWWKTIWGENSKEWRDIASWHGGRWSNLLVALDQYTTAT